MPYQGYTGWWDVGGTSAGAPQWAAIIAIANQGRVGKSPSLGSLTQTNAALYALYASYSTTDFHDITSGNNGRYVAGHGYDAVTGLGSPIVSSLVNDLVNNTSASFSVAKAASSTSIVGSDGPPLVDSRVLSWQRLRAVGPGKRRFQPVVGRGRPGRRGEGAASNGSPAAPSRRRRRQPAHDEAVGGRLFGQPHLAGDGLPMTDSSVGIRRAHGAAKPCG